MRLNRFELLIDWGYFYFITKPLFLAMDWIYHKVGNFGLAILIITVLIKIVFFPLANKSYASMAKMKAVQPEMMAIRERYADDKMKQQQAMMELYKKEKINPIAGCLPILIQIPVFFALYKVLFITIEMRHAPFFGWIKDLSAPDPTTIFNLFGLIPWDPTAIPVIGAFLHLGLWPIMMGVTMWLQMKLNPPPPDPTQKMIFDWMPLIFTFMLASFSAGLVIYWAWNNILSVLQQSVDHAQARRQDRAVRQRQGAVRQEEEGDKGMTTRGLTRRGVCARMPRRFTRAEIEAGRRLFAGDWQFAAAASTSTALPPMRGIEIAFAGRSNVGKSSLINALTGRRALARVSHTPGRTQELIFFEGDDKLTLVDMPGYGYAAASKTKVQAWTALIHAFLEGRANLARVYVLVDARHGLKPIDEDVLEDARRGGGELSDRAHQGRPGEREPALAERIAATDAALAKHAAAYPEVLATSARTGAGIAELRAAIGRLLMEARAAPTRPGIR